MAAKRSFFLLTASRDHLTRGVELGFIQQRHAKRIEKIKQGDCVVLYAGKETLGDKKPCQKILGWALAVDDEYETLDPKAMAQSIGAEASSCSPTDLFYRKKMEMHAFAEPLDIRPLLQGLSFVKNPSSWGFYFMSGFREIPKGDFELIRNSALPPSAS